MLRAYFISQKATAFYFTISQKLFHINGVDISLMDKLIIVCYNNLQGVDNNGGIQIKKLIN